MRGLRPAWVAVAASAALAATALGDPRVTLMVRVSAQAAPVPTDRFVTVDGLRLHVVDWGNATGQPLVLIHGLDRVARTFDPVARHFSSTHHVVAYDMRGHGDSGWDPQGRYLVEDHVGDLAGIVAQLGLRNIVVWGNSTGGRVAQVFAGMRPDLVANLIAEDVGPERPRQIADAYARRVQQEAGGWASEAELAAAVRKANPGMSQAVLDAYVQHGSKRAEGGRVVWKRDPNLVKGFVETDLWRFVRDITAPALYLLGGRSTIVTPATQDELGRTLPRVRIVTMPGLGHYPSDEQPAESMAIVESFLKGTPAQAQPAR
ncbi:MAG TPA: alpha/beta hydrolase [Vicinamibacterales bacterium]